MSTLEEICRGLPTDLQSLPRSRERDSRLAHAPKLAPNLSASETKLAISNALRYFPAALHPVLASEFAAELRNYGHIYMYRFVPSMPMKAYPIDQYPAKCRHAAAIMLMIMNNLDPTVAQFPEELVTYGGNGQVFSNWAQFWLVMNYLSTMTEDQTLVMYSGHPTGLFPSKKGAPRVVITNGMVVPNYSSKAMYSKMFALGVSMYGQMTAGSYCYIGPQGIVHGTTLTVLNAGRRCLGTSDLKGKVFVSAGLGGMSGAQAKAAVIAGCIGVIAEVSVEALEKRHRQGWVLEVAQSVDECVQLIRERRRAAASTSIAYLGNVVDLWERLAVEFDRTGELLVEFGSDQTSLHNPFLGGYYPVQLTYEESRKTMADDPEKFKQLVQESLKRQVAAINKLAKAGLYFFDYGNAFLLEASRAGAEVLDESSNASDQSGPSGPQFRYPSYMQHIMGDIFSLGFGPFRWICTSCLPQDLAVTDAIATEILQRLQSSAVSTKVKQQYEDNLNWITKAESHRMVVGSQARILYSDEIGRISLALAFNEAVASGKLKAPVVISRDHHDVSGTDSPFRETSNIYDGSAFCADMAVQNCIGDSFRGATWVALHNGGGVGWGEVVNGGFGLVLDGTEEAGENAQLMLQWDVTNGVTRRCWSGNANAEETIQRAMKLDPRLHVTLPNHVEDNGLLENAIAADDAS